MSRREPGAAPPHATRRPVIESGREQKPGSEAVCEDWPFGGAVRIIRLLLPGAAKSDPLRIGTVGGGMHDYGDVTRLLHEASQGNSDALHQVLTLLHERLRGLAHGQLAGERPGHTLETDGLVNEAYLRLTGLGRIEWRNREHLLSTAARMMRRVLIDYAEQRRTQKRGGGTVPIALDEVDGAPVLLDRHADELHALDEALARLADLSPRQGHVVECRFFGGLSIEETADVLGLSPATVKRDWTMARAWLNKELSA